MSARSFKPGTSEVMALQADYIDTSLNTFLKALITTYSRIPWAMDIPVSMIEHFFLLSDKADDCSAAMHARITPAGTEQDIRVHSLSRPSRGMIIQLSILLVIQRVLVDSHGAIRLNSRRLLSRLFTNWPSDVLCPELLTYIFLS
jgi:hypothetical protein